MTLEIQTDGKHSFKLISSLRFTKTTLFYVSNGVEYHEHLANIVSFSVVDLTQDQEIKAHQG